MSGEERDPHGTPEIRSGPLYWLRSYGLMVDWELRSMRLVLPLALVVQAFLGAGMVIGFGFLVGELPRYEAAYLATGVTVISMISIGLVLTPQLVAQQKLSGIFDYLWSLPVPRSTHVAATLTVNSLIAIPGMVLALLVASWRYDFGLTLQPVVIPATILTLITAASIGVAMAHAIPNPLMTGLVTQVLVFFILLFSPINFPAERLPGWLAAIHRLLPFQHSANLMRSGLVPGIAQGVGQSLLVLGTWTVVSWLITAWVVGRRG